jgi:hypothetical protein
MALDKGDRVKVIGGRKSKGVTGTIFWVGENNYGEGQRFGIRGDDGETHWVPEEHCEASDERMEVPEGPELGKGDRVQWGDADALAEGVVFWLGPNKYGPGTRVGVKDDAGETHWYDSRQLTKLDSPPTPTAHPDGPGPGGSAFDQPDAYGAPAAGWGDAPPIDDDWAASIGEPEPSEAAEISDDDIPF